MTVKISPATLRRLAIWYESPPDAAADRIALSDVVRALLLDAEPDPEKERSDRSPWAKPDDTWPEAVRRKFEEKT